jgi:hypothetical protein
MNPVTLLLIDDDPAYCLKLQTEGKGYRFDIVAHHNLEDGMEALVASRRIKAVILDGRCFLEPGQGVARANFVYHALQRIADIENEYNRSIPVCINTEHCGDFIEDLDGIAQVFSKADEHAALFEWVKSALAQLPETVVRKRFVETFEKTAPYFTDEEDDLLVDVLQTAHLSDPAIIITNLALLRRLLERLADIACVKKLNKDPLEFSEGHGSRTRRILETMHRRALPHDLFVSANQLYVICSKYGNHQNLPTKGELPYSPNKYLVQSLVFAYLALVDHLLD